MQRESQGRTTLRHTKLQGTWRDDHVSYSGGPENTHQTLIGIATFGGADSITVSNPYRGQVHIFAGTGDDSISLVVDCHFGDQARMMGDPQTPTGISRNGHHVYGGDGADAFDFQGVSQANNLVIGRIDDFDPTTDQIHIEGERLDLDNPPSGVQFILFQGQQWIKIGDNILYALEGARRVAGGAEELHFAWLPPEWASGIPKNTGIEYKNPYNFVPFEKYKAARADLHTLKKSSSWYEGTENSDYMYSDKSGGSNDVIFGNAGHDVIFGNTGYDKIFGGKGRDLISGGIDRDKLYGGGGRDKIWGGDQNDRIQGGGGRDRIFGNSGKDFLTGGSGNDFLSGGQGADRILGGGGFDKVVGGPGPDAFIFKGKSSDRGFTILDFQDNYDEIIIRSFSAPSFSQGPNGVLIQIENGAEIHVKGWNIASVDSWDWMQI